MADDLERWICAGGDLTFSEFILREEEDNKPLTAEQAAFQQMMQARFGQQGSMQGMQGMQPGQVIPVHGLPGSLNNLLGGIFGKW
jgi:hypothetical protein